MNLIDGLELLNQVLPRGSMGFALRVLLDTGVRSIVFRRGEDAWAMRLRRTPGMCDIGNGAIEIDMEMKLEEVRKVIFQWHLISIDPLEVPLWVLLHEVGHVIHGASQDAAEEFAKERFLEWRRSKEKR